KGDRFTVENLTYARFNIHDLYVTPDVIAVRHEIIIRRNADAYVTEDRFLNDVFHVRADEESGVDFFIQCHLLRYGFVILPKGCCCKDRKSTRLNSSHVIISYVVFCVKEIYG